MLCAPPYALFLLSRDCFLDLGSHDRVLWGGEELGFLGSGRIWSHPTLNDFRTIGPPACTNYI